ncbi:hypothetical protein 1 [Hubei tombus-like virus 42]|uniref:hypothetical protein 1 n=1 Tax=Hubei tombus-like virus 42 TaxID=1923290 RepID=UPI000909FE80|nr:hypothetical protein 1 [Hubei tombus-like virus 42]APG76279.1 hypothetical protein 1 [Hubei tombus-like virus 42]
MDASLFPLNIWIHSSQQHMNIRRAISHTLVCVVQGCAVVKDRLIAHITVNIDDPMPVVLQISPPSKLQMAINHACNLRSIVLSSTICVAKRLSGAISQAAQSIHTGLHLALHYTLLGAAVTAIIIWFIKTRKCRIIKVRNHNQMADIRRIKEQFATKIKRLTPPEFEQGKHVICAWERKTTEQIINEWFHDQGIKFRDIGGSRVRGSNYATSRHICNPTLDSSDILRRAKQPTTIFSECTCLGQHCPYKNEYPGAMFIHSDYYLDANALTDCVRSHTFVVTHRFTGDEGTFFNEAQWVKHGTKITMTTPDGTKYNHPYNLWENEGCIVGSSNACIYAKVGSTETSDIYYLFPADGTYLKDDRLALKRSTELAEPLHPSGYVIIKSDQFFIYDDHDNLMIKGPVDIISRMKLRLGLAARTSNFNSVFFSYLQARCQAEEIGITDPLRLTEFALRETEQFALTIAPRWSRQWDPANMTLCTGLKLRLHRMYNTIIRATFDLLPTCRLRCIFAHRILAPWAYREITLPGYIMEVRPQHTDVRGLRPSGQPFPDDGTDNDAEPDNSESVRADSVSGEFDSQSGNESDGYQTATSSRSHVRNEAPIVDTDASTTSTPGQSGRTASLLPTDGMDSETSRQIRPITRQDSADFEKSLIIFSGPSSSTSLPPTVVLDPNRNTVSSALYDDPILLTAEQFRSLCQSKDAVLKAHFSTKRTREQIYHQLVQEARRAKRHPSETAGGGISEDPGNGVVPTPSRTTTVRPVGQEIPKMAPQTTRDSQNESGQSRDNVQRRPSSELHKARDHPQVHRPKKHQSTHRRVSGHSRSLHQRHRETRSSRPIPGQRHGAKDARKEDG